MKMIQKILMSGLLIVLFGCGQKGPLVLNDTQTQAITDKKQTESKLTKQEITPEQTENTETKDKSEEKYQ